MFWDQNININKHNSLVHTGREVEIIKYLPHWVIIFKFIVLNIDYQINSKVHLCTSFTQIMYINKILSLVLYATVLTNAM